MQLTAITPGATIGAARITEGHGASQPPTTFAAPIHAGKVVMTGIHDIRAAAGRMIGEHFEGPGRTLGLVGFIRNGDAWDAVELLAPTHPGSAETQIWAPWNVASLTVAPGVQLDAIWQISGYGVDAGWRTPGTHIPETH